jgi:hypothetical protein
MSCISDLRSDPELEQGSEKRGSIWRPIESGAAHTLYCKTKINPTLLDIFKYDMTKLRQITFQ